MARSAKTLVDRHALRPERRRRRATRSSLMTVGRRVDYAIRAMSYLAAQPPERVVTRREIEASQDVALAFLAKILRSLVSAGLLESVAGAHGGFRLSRAPQDISVRNVYEAVEGPLSLSGCVDKGTHFCCFAGVCKQIDIWRGAQQVLMDYLDGISIGQIADRQGMTWRLENRATASRSSHGRN